MYVVGEKWPCLGPPDEERRLSFFNQTRENNERGWCDSIDDGKQASKQETTHSIVKSTAIQPNAHQHNDNSRHLILSYRGVS